MLRSSDQRAEEQKMLRVVIREALRPALQLVSQLQESLFPIDNESGFVSSFAYGETRKNTPFVRPCTDGTVDEGDVMCAFPCIRILTVDCACEQRVPTFLVGNKGPKSPRSAAQKENQNASKQRSESRGAEDAHTTKSYHSNIHIK